MIASIPKVLGPTHGTEPPVGVESNTAVATVNPRTNRGLNQGCLRLSGTLLRPALLGGLLLGPALSWWLLLRPTLLGRWLLPRLCWLSGGLRGWCRGLLDGRVGLGRLPLSQRPANRSDGFGQRCGFFCCRGRNEFRQGYDAVAVRVGLCMKGGRFLNAGPGGLCQFFNVQRSTAVFVCGDEVFSGTHELGFFLGRYDGFVGSWFHRFWRFGFRNQLRAERSRKGILGRFCNLFLAFDVEALLRYGFG